MGNGNESYLPSLDLTSSIFSMAISIAVAMAECAEEGSILAHDDYARSNNAATGWRKHETNRTRRFANA